MLAQEWFYGLMTRPNMEQNIQWMFVLLRPKRSVDIKVERKLHDMRMLGRIVKVRSTEQSVWHQLLTNLNVINARAKSLKARCACTNIKLEENKCV